MKICVLDACIEVHTRQPERLYRSLVTEFARRYIPPIRICNDCSQVEAVVHWISGDEFRVLATSFSDELEDFYMVTGPYPEAYVNEGPLFFMLQVIARSLVRRGHVIITDSVFMNTGKKGILLLGFPHTGKSTITSIAIDRGYKVVSTENTIVRASGEKLEVESGTRILVFDPKIRELFGVKIGSTGKTRHGYELVDLDFLGARLGERLYVDEIYVLYTSFSSKGVSATPITGRKVSKLIWYFAVGLLKGIDYYEPSPIDIPLTPRVMKTLTELIDVIKVRYSNRFYEVYGSPVEVFEYITQK